MGYFTVAVSAGGELVLPHSLRSSLHLEEGGTAMIREEDGIPVLDSIASRVARARAIVQKYISPGTLTADDFIAERRVEAERE